MTPAIRNAFVLGAGLGTRLKNLTARKPKPLIPICGKPLITFAFDHLMRNGVTKLVVNTHHCPDAYATAFPDASYRNVPLHFKYEPILLETGGGIKNVECELGDESFITYSGDILSDVNLAPLIGEHFRRGNDVTLALRKTGLASAIALRDGAVVDISNRYGIPGEFDFANIAVWSMSIFGRIPEVKKISFISIVRDWIGEGGRIGGVVLGDGKWFNIGSREQYLEAHRYFAQPRFDFVAERKIDGTVWPRWIHPSARIEPGAKIEGATAIGARSWVGERASLVDCIVWEDAEIAPDSSLERCIVTAGQRVSGTHVEADF